MKSRKHVIVFMGLLFPALLIAGKALADPHADAGPNQDNIDEETSVTLDGSKSRDDDDLALTYLWTQTDGPTVQLSDPTAVQPTFSSPSVAGDTDLTFQLTVTNTDNEQDSDNTRVRVKNVNKSPAANAGPDQTISENTDVTLDGSGSSDPDGDSITYFWEQIAGPTVTLNDTRAAKPSFTAPSVDNDTQLTFRLTVTDPSNASSSDEVSITVSNNPPVNLPPIANAGPDQTVNEGTRVTLDGSASSDPNGDALTYSWTQIAGPTVSLDDATKSKPEFDAPQVDADTTLAFLLTVTDPAGLAASDGVAVTVKNVPPEDRAPVANAGPDQSVNEKTQVTLDGSASSDPDGDALTYAWSQISGPGVTLNNSTSVSPQFTAPDVSSNEVLLFQLTVQDPAGAASTDQVSITVSNVVPGNLPPVVNAGPNQTVDEKTVVRLAGSGSDPDGDPLFYIWAQISGPPVSLNGANTSAPTFTAPTVESITSLIFQLNVNDGRGGQANDTVTITVHNAAAQSGINNFSIAPNPSISMEKGTTIRFSLTEDSEVTLFILDLFGNLVLKKVFLPGSTGATAGTNSYRWDWKNGEGDVVASGGYLVQMNVKNAHGESKIKGKVAIVR